MSNEAQLSDGTLIAQRDAPVGGQAILEGVMMRGVSTWATAVRKPLPTQGELQPTEAPLGGIEIQSFPLVSWTKRHRALRLPVVRGVVALAESLRIGFKALNISANAQQPEDAEPIGGGTWVFAVVAALCLSVGLFFVLPVTATSLVFRDLLGVESAFLFWLVEGIVRTAIFLGYLVLIARLKDLRRVFEYHGAEHKTISCYEAGLPLTPENAQRFSRLHPRCGTSFLLIVMIVAIFVFAPLGLPEWYWLVLSRVLGIPLIAGLSFEIIKWAGRNRRHGWVRGIMWPGLQLQKLTTREPDDDQLAVAIAAMEAVLAVEDPRQATAADKVGMEVVA